MAASVAVTPRPPAAKKRRERNHYAWSSVAFIFPAMLLVMVLLYIPFIYTSFLSFTEYNGVGTPEPVGFENFADIFSDPTLLRSLLNTAIWVVGTLVLPVGLGLLIAVLAHGIKGSAWYKLPFLLPYAISGVAVGVVWTFILQTNGALHEALTNLNMPGTGARWLLDWPLNTIVMIVAATWQGAGVNALLFGIGLNSIPKEPIEAARLDGASGWKMFRHITWPMITPITTVVVGLAIVGSLKTFDIVWAMTKGGPGRKSETLALTMYKETFTEYRYGLGAALAVVLTIVTVTSALLYLRRQLAPAKEF